MLHISRAFRVVLAILCGLCVLGTALDLAVPKILPGMGGKAGKALKSFSVYTNARKLLETSMGPDNLGCLHGMRFLSMAWVVLGHTWISLNNQFTWNGVDVQQVINGTRKIWCWQFTVAHEFSVPRADV